MTDQQVPGSVRNLMDGRAPGCGDVLHKISCGTDFLVDFLSKHYLESYIPEGGSKIKFLTGRSGAGKTHMLQLLTDSARTNQFLAVNLSANEVWLHDFRELYLSILKQCDLEEVLLHCAEEIIREMGYDPAEISHGKTLIDHLAERNEADPLSKNIIRTSLRQRFTQNPVMDNCFAACCALLVGDLLGYPVLDSSSRELILSFLHGDRTVKASQLRAIGISPSKVTKYNARHLLRSLSALIRMSGYAGLFVAVDDMECLLNRSSQSLIHYTKAKREDAYESIRQLIDDIEDMQYLFFLLSFDRELMDNENSGLKSYQALWMRIQNEVVSRRFNRFADILDLDRFADEIYSADVLCEMSEKLATLFQGYGIPASPIAVHEADELADAALYGNLGLPYLVNRKVLAGGTDNV